MIRRIAFLVTAVLASATALAIDTDRAFEDPEMQARYEALIAEVRCVTCQNQSIKDSNASIASDLRREIRRMMAEGRSNDEISEFLVTRYGEFILYRPRTSGKTMILWLAPFIFLILGSVAIVRVLRKRMSMPLDDEDATS